MLMLKIETDLVRRGRKGWKAKVDGRRVAEILQRPRDMILAEH